MAEIAKRRAANVRGEFFVDATCIDCGTCRQVAPETFAESRDASYVHRQPADEGQSHRARMALVACPVAAIGTETKHRIADARAAFPELIEDGVYYCGYAAESSYGARSYLIVRPGGNILVDSPRFAAPLVSGDHAWWDARRNRVHASKSVCWYDWKKQTASMARLLDYGFEWLLPGHGMRCRLPQKRMAAEVAAMIERMKMGVKLGTTRFGRRDLP